MAVGDARSICAVCCPAAFVRKHHGKKPDKRQRETMRERVEDHDHDSADAGSDDVPPAH